MPQAHAWREKARAEISAEGLEIARKHTLPEICERIQSSAPPTNASGSNNTAIPWRLIEALRLKLKGEGP